jgi:hypothetical protein
MEVLNHRAAFWLVPFQMLRRGHFLYIAYLLSVGAILGFTLPHLHQLLLNQGAKLLADKMASAEEIENLRRIIELLILAIASPVVLAALAAPVAEMMNNSGISLKSLLERTPRGVVFAGAALIAIFFRSFRLLIPLFLLSFCYLLAENSFALGEREFYGAVGVTALVLLIFLWRSVKLLAAPVAGVCWEIGGKRVLSESARILTGWELSLWLLVLGCTVFITLTELVPLFFEISSPQQLRCGASGLVIWYGVTALAGLVCSSSRSPAASK